MKKYQLDNPSNARIFIDFSNTKNPVKFEYPHKKTIFNFLFMHVLTYYFIFFIPFFIINLALIIIFYENIYNTNIILIHGNLELFLIYLPTIILFFTIIPVIITLVFSKRLIMNFPKINTSENMFLGRGYNSILVKDLKSKKYTLPIFDNVFLEYILKEDYKKYIKKIIVKEYDFWHLKMNIFNRKKSKVKQTTYWKAEFIFSKVPQKGEMILNWI